MDILQYLFKIIALSSIGIIVASIIEETNLISKIKRITKPICLISNLPEECVLSLLGNFINPTVGKSMLAGFYKENKINEKEVIVTTIISPLPTILGESIFRVQLPLAVVILGYKLGLIYVSLNVISGFLQALIGILYANIFFKRRQIEINNDNNEKLVFNREVIIKGFKKSLKILKKVIPMIVIFTILINYLIKLGLMDVVRGIFSPVFRILDLPGEAIAVLIANLAHFSAGYATVDILIKNGILNEKQALIVLLIANIIGVTMIYLKHSIGTYIALFGRFGLKLAMINYAVSVMVKILLILLLILVL
ncbi:nucleoside recognition domain protein [Methanocaldococcus sp. FS406-22]|uniref:nucleoside recognition domain-containing protein n=1 Tax=Methanocaldococcus sp. (strain FS406-22) TaxID=644281 RepID=UPI0001BF5417|nr:nucleoside recognition domain-containing protein [Methanocaldococcus sp. FS406-22]ADC69955.1 nucleoside recognition domain protein [Methanocaldococcus sp. FS406-22]